MRQTHQSDSPVAIFASNRGLGLLGARLIIEAFARARWTVVLATADDHHARSLVRCGAVLEPVKFVSRPATPFADASAFQRLRTICDTYQPRLMHLFNTKPIILGSLATRRDRGVRTIVVSTITGLGYVFQTRGLHHHLLTWGYRKALPRSNMTVFLNPDDQELFLKEQLVDSSRSRLIVSRGIDVHRFLPGDAAAQQQGVPRVLMMGRLLWQKGIAEFVAAARIVKQQRPEVVFCLAGEADPNHPDGVPRRWLQAAAQSGDIEYCGYVRDVPELLKQVSVAVLPSYREGVPRALLEMAASGLPIVTTDAPGCREAVVDGVTGYLVPPKDPQKLAERILDLLADPEKGHRFGVAGRLRVVENFSSETIAAQHLQLYRELGVVIEDRPI